MASEFLGEADYSMIFIANRLMSFVDWPFKENCKCTPEKMAEAGFYHCPTQHEPDLVRCFACYKELDGWQPEDDPWIEHKSHSSECPMIKYQKSENDLTVIEFLDIVKQKEINRVKKIAEKAKRKYLQLRTKIEEQSEESAK